MAFAIAAMWCVVVSMGLQNRELERRLAPKIRIENATPIDSDPKAAYFRVAVSLSTGFPVSDSVVLINRVHCPDGAVVDHERWDLTFAHNDEPTLRKDVDSFVDVLVVTQADVRWGNRNRDVANRLNGRPVFDQKGKYKIQLAASGSQTGTTLAEFDFYWPGSGQGASLTKAA